jgi:dTDP-L-rhamnose 4-epimerase
MPKRILITGGAGFIGSHLADELLSHGYQVRVLDCLHEQVHGAPQEPSGNGRGESRIPGNGRNGRHPGNGQGNGKKTAWRRPSYLNPDVDLVIGDVRDPEAVRRSLEGIDAVYHFAARVGVGQSMYEIRDYVDTNNGGTAVLLEALAARPVERLIVASSMSLYGEGPYRGADGRIRHDVERSPVELRSGLWDPRSDNGQPLAPIAVPESKPPSLASVYALSKYDQERLGLVFGRAYGIPTVALRFFNVYGTRQALSNPYTGVLAIFASRLLNDHPPMIFEDGQQRRDFVNVKDVVRASWLALESRNAPGQAINVGSGRSFSVREVADSLARVLGKPHIEPLITGKYRAGDIRHCFADITLARELLGYEPRVTLEEGLTDLAGWLAGQVAHDRVDQMNAELSSRGLTI